LSTPLFYRGGIASPLAPLPSPVPDLSSLFTLLAGKSIILSRCARGKPFVSGCSFFAVGHRLSFATPPLPGGHKSTFSNDVRFARLIHFPRFRARLCRKAASFPRCGMPQIAHTWRRFFCSLHFTLLPRDAKFFFSFTFFLFSPMRQFAWFFQNNMV